MPCKLPDDDLIPLARYGNSNIGRMKTVYRQGLAHRYGRRMQAISGIHYNFSLPEEAWPRLREAEGSALPLGAYRDQRYLALIRNFRRHSWLLLLLLGTAPAACGSFVAGRSHRLSTWDTGTVFAPGATSLRMGGLGYQSDAQASLAVSFNDLRGYATTLARGLTEPYPPYEAIGLREGDDYRQLATTLLQIENEFYGTIRPKRTIRRGERPLHALGERGIEYLEVRCLDVDPFHPVGIHAGAIRLLDIFLLHCLLSDSPRDDPGEIAAMARNQRLVAESGRDPQAALERAGEKVLVVDWAAELLARCEPIAAALDEAHGGERYGEVLAAARGALRDPVVAAVGTGAAGDGAGARKELSGVRAGAVVAAPRRARGVAPGSRGRGALRRVRGAVAGGAGPHRGRGRPAVRDLPPPLSRAGAPHGTAFPFTRLIAICAARVGFANRQQRSRAGSRPAHTRSMMTAMPCPTPMHIVHSA